MGKDNNQLVTVTAEQVSGIISQSQCGEYDQYHDWTPSYSLQDKSEFLDELLKNWEKTEPKGRSLIMDFTRSLIKDSREGSIFITNKLVFYSKIPEIMDVVCKSLFSAFFSYNLLVSMKNRYIKQEEWLERIKQITENHKFIEKKKDITRNDLYRKIQQFILELG